MSSRRRSWIVGLVLVGAASGVYLATRGSGSASSAPASSTPHRTAPVATRNRPSEPAAAIAPVVAAAPAAPTQIPLDLGKGDASPSVKKWKEAGLPGTFREIVAPDDGENLEEKLTYRLRRLRFSLTDAAAVCYEGGDGKEQIDFAYTMHVAGGKLSTSDVRVLSSTWDDSKVQDCIVDAVVHMRAAAPDVPDMTQEQSTSISQHDLYERSRSTE